MLSKLIFPSPPSLGNIYKLKVLKICSTIKKTLPKSFNNFYHTVSQAHSYTRRYTSDDNLALLKCNILLTQHSIRYTGCKIRNDLPAKLLKHFI